MQADSHQQTFAADLHVATAGGNIDTARFDQLTLFALVKFIGRIFPQAFGEHLREERGHMLHDHGGHGQSAGDVGKKGGERIGAAGGAADREDLGDGGAGRRRSEFDAMCSGRAGERRDAGSGW